MIVSFASFARLIAVALTVGLLGQPAAAVEPGEVLTDAALEGRARALSAELRCLVCQNQSIDDSNAPLAKDLRLLVRERLAAGDSNEAVMSYIVARYGDFVLLRPPVKATTVLLWLAPLLCLVAIGYALLRLSGRITGSGMVGTERGLSGEEEARLADYLARQPQPARKATSVPETGPRTP